YDVENLAAAFVALLRQKSQAAHNIIAVNLINQPVDLSANRAFQKSTEKKRTARPVNSSEPGDDSAGCQNQIFCLAQNLSLRMARFRRSTFVDDAAVGLCVNARAARKQKRRVWESVEKIFRPF